MRAQLKSKFLRFGIVNENNLRSATWNLRSSVNTKTGLPEVYLFCRELGDSIHASMHPSGQWHIKYPKKFFEDEIRNISPLGTDQYIQKWERPREIKLGITLAFRIITPSSAVTTKAENLKEPFVKIPSAPKGKATDIRVFFIAPNITKVRDAGIVGVMPLNNSERVLVTHQVIDIQPPFDKRQAQPRFLKGKSEEDLKDSDLKAIILGDASDGSRIIWDCAVSSNKQ
jgi:hypothetical protein